MGENSESNPVDSAVRGVDRMSWINRLSDGVERLPGPSWTYYTGLWLALVGIQMVVLVSEGAQAGQTYHPAQAYLAGAIAFLLGMFAYLDRQALAALHAIQPVLKADAEALAQLEKRMINLPSVGAIVSFLLALGVVLLTEAVGGTYRVETLESFQTTRTFIRIVYLICWGVFGTFIYQTLHRLSLIQEIYSHWTTVNLFRRQPLYALSNVTAISAASLTILPIGFLIANRLTNIQELDAVAVAVVVVIEATAFISFLWPQFGIRRLQREAKGRLLDEVNQLYQKALRELHQRVDQGELEASEELNITFTILEREMKHVQAIPIWPWDPETLRWLITALILPLSLMVLQLVLQRLFE